MRARAAAPPTNTTVGAVPAPKEPDRRRTAGVGESNRVLQAKLRVGRTDDPLEREADRAADAVLADRTIGPLVPAPAQPQRHCAGCQEEEEKLLMKPAAGGPAPAGADVAAAAVAAGGRPLSAAERAYFEPRFGRDFSGVRIHDGPEASAAATAINARAYTLGSDIAFAAGSYAPATRDGRRLLAHELAHTVQQEQGGKGTIRRAEVVDRPGVCTSLTDTARDVDTHVHAQMAAARADPLKNWNNQVMIADIALRLGGAREISPIEKFIHGFPAGKVYKPARNLSGTRFAGVEAVNRFYLLHTQGAQDVVGPTAKVNGICVGADKLGHFFQQGFQYYTIESGPGGSQGAAESFGRASEIFVSGLATTGVYSNADLAANLAGLRFYRDLAANPTGLTFSISNYIANDWNEQYNPNYYEQAVAEVVWANQLTGDWRGPFTVSGSSQAIPTNVNLTATTGGAVTGTYSYTSGATTTQGNITGGSIAFRTTSVAGSGLGKSFAASPVSGVTITYDWDQDGLAGKGKWESLNEVSLEGTWGNRASDNDGGTWNIDKV